MSALLDVTGLSKIYPLADAKFHLWPGRAHHRSLHAVDDVSFSVAAGESLGMVGESGCGKSTVVRLLARLIDVTAGTIMFDGRDISAIPASRFGRDPSRREIQVVFQDPEPQPAQPEPRPGGAAA